MAARKRIPKTVPDYRVTKVENDPEEHDLKKVKARIKKELEEDEAKKNAWLDDELDKNLKKP